MKKSISLILFFIFIYSCSHKTIGSKTKAFVEVEESKKVHVTQEEKMPLFVVDGVPYNKDPCIEPEDIISLEVLQGKEIITKYGEKAKNGVLLIVTKSKIKNRKCIKKPKVDKSSKNKIKSNNSSNIMICAPTRALLNDEYKSLSYRD